MSGEIFRFKHHFARTRKVSEPCAGQSVHLDGGIRVPTLDVDDGAIR